MKSNINYLSNLIVWIVKTKKIIGILYTLYIQKHTPFNTLCLRSIRQFVNIPVGKRRYPPFGHHYRDTTAMRHR